MRKVSRDADGPATYLNVLRFAEHLRRFLYEQLHPHNDPMAVSLDDLPPILSRIIVYPSATAIFRAPCDHSGILGMRRERIRSVRSWQGGAPRHDCAFLTKDSALPGFQGLFVVRIHAFLSFIHHHTTYPCALVSWFLPIGDVPCPETGMWRVRPEHERGTGGNMMSIPIIRGAGVNRTNGPPHWSGAQDKDAFRLAVRL